MRCMALAIAWQAAGGQVDFICRVESPSIKARLRDTGVSVIELAASHPDPEDMRQVLGHLERLTDAPVTLVIDGYHFDPAYHKMLAGSGRKIMLIDDIGDQPTYHADVILNQNVGPDAAFPYPPSSVQLLGPRYALLRSAFLAYDDWSRRAPDGLLTILVTMGSSDRDQVTAQALTGLAVLDPATFRIRVMIGPANQHRAELQALAEPYEHVSCIFDPEDVPAEMAAADLVVTAAGSTCWELAYMMAPMITMMLAENQRPVTETLSKAGAAVNLGDCRKVTPSEIVDAVIALELDRIALGQMAQAGRHLVDGKGAARVVEILMNGSTLH